MDRARFATGLIIGGLLLTGLAAPVLSFPVAATHLLEGLHEPITSIFWPSGRGREAAAAVLAFMREASVPTMVFVVAIRMAAAVITGTVVQTSAQWLGTRSDGTPTKLGTFMAATGGIGVFLFYGSWIRAFWLAL